MDIGLVSMSYEYKRNVIKAEIVVHMSSRCTSTWGWKSRLSDGFSIIGHNGERHTGKGLKADYKLWIFQSVNWKLFAFNLILMCSLTRSQKPIISHHLHMLSGERKTNKQQHDEGWACVNTSGSFGLHKSNFTTAIHCTIYNNNISSSCLQHTTARKLMHQINDGKNLIKSRLVIV